MAGEAERGALFFLGHGFSAIINFNQNDSFLLTEAKHPMAIAIDTKVLTAHIPLPLAEKVDQLAAQLERSRGWIMKQALAAWVDQEEQRTLLTREALDDVDSGALVDHAAMLAWSASLSKGAALPLPLPTPTALRNSQTF